MIYIVIATLAVMAIIIIFAFLMAIINCQRKSEKWSTVFILKILNILELSIHTKTNQRNSKKKKNK